MENIALLIGLIIKWGILLIAVTGIIRLLVLGKSGRKHILTMIITILFSVLSIYIFIGNYISRKSEMNKIAGDYKLTYYMCEKCPDCIVRLYNNGAYQLIKNQKVIDGGNWDYEKELLTILLKIENGSSNDIVDSTKTISYIKNDNCQKYWRNQNLKQEINGTVIQIDTINNHFGICSIWINDKITGENIYYEPKYMDHPWINDKIEIGYYILKEKNSMRFMIKELNGDTIIVNER